MKVIVAFDVSRLIKFAVHWVNNRAAQQLCVEEIYYQSSAVWCNNKYLCCANWLEGSGRCSWEERKPESFCNKYLIASTFFITYGITSYAISLGSCFNINFVLHTTLSSSPWTKDFFCFLLLEAINYAIFTFAEISIVGDS